MKRHPHYLLYSTGEVQMSFEPEPNEHCPEKGEAFYSDLVNGTIITVLDCRELLPQPENKVIIKVRPFAN